MPPQQPPFLHRRLAPFLPEVFRVLAAESRLPPTAPWTAAVEGAILRVQFGQLLDGVAPQVASKDEGLALKQALDALYGPCCQQVHRAGGSTISLDADGLWAFFPAASAPDIRQRACQAALEAALRMTDPAGGSGKGPLRLFPGVRVGCHFGHATLGAIDLGGWTPLFLGKAVHESLEAALSTETNSVFATNELLSWAGTVRTDDAFRHPGGALVRGVPLLQDRFEPVDAGLVRAGPKLARWLSEAVGREIRELCDSDPPSACISLHHRQIVFLRVRGHRTIPDTLAIQILDSVARAFATHLKKIGGRLQHATVSTGELSLMASLPAILECVGAALELASFFDFGGRFDLEKPAAGMAQGRVFRGEVGTDVRHQIVLLGPALATARRLCQLAEPGQTLVCPRTRAGASKKFVFQVHRPPPSGDLRFQRKPTQEPPGGYMLISVRRSQEREETVAPLVGRALEIATIDAALEEALAQGTGTALLITGAKGLGKSRILESAAKKAKTRGFHVATIQCQPPESPWDLQPLAELFLALAGDKSLEVPKKPNTFAEALAGKIFEVASRTPILATFDDLHGTTRLTRGVLAKLTMLLHRKPIVLVAATEASESAEEPLRSSFELLELQPLDHEEAVELILSVIPQSLRPTDEEILLLAEESRGNPRLLIEGIGKLTIPHGVEDLGDASGWGLVT